MAAYHEIMFTCEQCGHVFDLPDRDQLRPMPKLKNAPRDEIPQAIVCPQCDTVCRITYPS
jgi:rubredoxin